MTTAASHASLPSAHDATAQGPMRSSRCLRASRQRGVAVVNVSPRPSDPFIDRLIMADATATAPVTPKGTERPFATAGSQNDRVKLTGPGQTRSDERKICDARGGWLVHYAIRRNVPVEVALKLPVLGAVVLIV